MKLRLALGFYLISIFSISCKHEHPSVTESLLSEGMKITASTPSGKISIEGLKGFRRRYSGDDWSKSPELIPRQTRWYGSLGLYDPATSNSLNDRLLLDEGKQFFNSHTEALRYMKFLSGFFGELTYNNTGLVVAYKVSEIPGGKPARHLTIWQFYINGVKPTAMPGAVDQNIEISGGSMPERSFPAPAPVGYERELASLEYKAPK